MSGPQFQDQPRDEPREAAAEEVGAPRAKPVVPEATTPEENAESAAATGDGVHSTDDPVVDDGREVVEDLDELVAKAAKADEYLALAQRTQADFENFRKRMTRDVAVAQERGIGKLAKELLPAIDNLDRALAAAEGANGAGGGDLVAGVKLVHDELLAALGRVGIERFSPKGERFDPTEHEAMLQQPVEGAEAGTVVEVYQQGFRLEGTVLRPARVVVAA